MDYSLDDYIRQLLEHDRADARAHAAWRLGRLRDGRGVRPLMQATADSEALVRLRAYESLGILRDPIAIDLLLQGLHDPDPDVATAAAQALGNLKVREASEELVLGLGAAYPPLRSACASALGAMLADGVTPALVKTLLDDPERDVRQAASRALVALGGDSTPPLLQALHDYQADAPILIDLLECLGQIRDPAARAALEALLQHPDADVVTMTRWALGM